MSADTHNDSLEFVAAVIHAKILLRKNPPDLVGAYIADRFPALSPDDIEHVLINAGKWEPMVTKQGGK